MQLKDLHRNANNRIEINISAYFFCMFFFISGEMISIALLSDSACCFISCFLLFAPCFLLPSFCFRCFFFLLSALYRFCFLLVAFSLMHFAFRILYLLSAFCFLLLCILDRKQ